MTDRRTDRSHTNSWCSKSVQSFDGTESSYSSSASSPSVDSPSNSQQYSSLFPLQGRRRISHKSSSSNSTNFSSKFSGMNLGDVMRVTVMEEMSKLNMTQNKPMDLSDKPKDFSSTYCCDTWK